MTKFEKIGFAFNEKKQFLFKIMDQKPYLRIFFDEIFHKNFLKIQVKDFFFIEKNSFQDIFVEGLLVQTKKCEVVILKNLKNHQPVQILSFKNIPCEEEIADFIQFSKNEILFLGKNSILSFFEFDLKNEKIEEIDQIMVREGSIVEGMKIKNNSAKIFIGLFDKNNKFYIEVLEIGRKKLFKILNFRIDILKNPTFRLGLEVFDEGLLSVIGVYGDSGFTEIRSFNIEKKKVFECNRVNFKCVVDFMRFQGRSLWVVDRGNKFKFYNF